MLDVAHHIVEALKRNQKILVFMPDLDMDLYITIFGATSSAQGVLSDLPAHNIVIATEQKEHIGKHLPTAHKGVDIPIVNAKTLLNINMFDIFCFVSKPGAAKYVLKLISDFSVDPSKIHVANGLFTPHVGFVGMDDGENDSFKSDNKGLEIADTITITGGLSSRILVSQIYDCVRNIAAKKIPGDIVNLGVWKGWSMKYFLLLLDHFGLKDKKVIGFDTFDGFVFSGKGDVFSARNPEFAEGFKGISTDEVAANLAPFSSFRLIKGNIADTMNTYEFPHGLCLTLFDMDDYTPTKLALPEMYKRTNKDGFFVHDHYGMLSSREDLICVGQRIAMDEFLKNHYMFHLSNTNIFVKS